MTTSRHTSAAATSDRLMLALGRWMDVSWPRILRWWTAQTARTKLVLAVAALFAAASLVDLSMTGLGKVLSVRAPAVPAAAQPASAPTVALESAPTDPTRTWAVLKIWQGSGSRETDAFTVGAHWRVDWLFNPAKAGDTLQVFIYSADGRLLQNLAANTPNGGADTSFWAGPGTYFLKVNSSGGDWKVDVQDLR